MAGLCHPERLRRILIIQKQALGDVVLTSPVFTLMRKSLPGASLHFLTNAPFAPLFEHLETVDRVWAYPYGPGSLRGVLSFARRIRRQRYDLVVDYQGTTVPALLTLLSGARWRLGWGTVPRRWAYNLYSRANRLERYVPVQKCLALRTIGIEGYEMQPRVSYSVQDVSRARVFLSQRSGEGSRPIINLSVKSKRQARQWMPDRFARLSDLLTDRLNALVTFNAASGEQAYVEQVARLCRRPPILLPVWPLSTFAAFLSLCRLHISHDNGTKHLAVAVGTPTIAFFGTDPPHYWQVPGNPRHVAVVGEAPCRFCGFRRCGWMACLASIQEEEVFSLARHLLNSEVYGRPLPGSGGRMESG